MFPACRQLKETNTVQLQIGFSHAPLLPSVPVSQQRLCEGESFRAFCMHTSLHGWHYMVDRSQRAMERTMWAAIVFLAVVTASTFLYNNTWVGRWVHC